MSKKYYPQSVLLIKNITTTIKTIIVSTVTTNNHIPTPLCVSAPSNSKIHILGSNLLLWDLQDFRMDSLNTKQKGFRAILFGKKSVTNSGRHQKWMWLNCVPGEGSNRMIFFGHSKEEVFKFVFQTHCMPSTEFVQLVKQLFMCCFRTID